MALSELTELETLAQVDELSRKVTRWASQESPWEPLGFARALVRRVVSRLETLRSRLTAPLVVATFGGTGTGKSALVNALIGRECTASGQLRPTTTKPIVIVHPDTSLEAIGLPLDQTIVERALVPVLRDLVIIDCPDPDTSEAETGGSNLARLHQLLPYCDVLIYVSTQQKYRNNRVVDELAQAAPGCRLVFVQTRADLDSDIRDDWRSQLQGKYEVPDMFFVDSVRALKEQRAGQPPTGEFQRLVWLLTTELSAERRLQVRHANVLDLVHAACERCQAHLRQRLPALEKVEKELELQRQKLVTRMTKGLQDELLTGGMLWERRLLVAVTEHWGASPFSAVLRFYNGFGAWLASAGLFRARTTAQMALIGAVHGARWLSSKNQEAQTESRLERVASFGLDDALLRESQLVIAGYVEEADLDPALLQTDNFDRLRHEAVRVEDEFLGDARQKIDEIIDQLAAEHAGPVTRWTFEALFLSLVVYICWRSAYNFFYSSLFLDKPLLTSEYYVHAAVFLGLWSGGLVMAFAWLARRGLHGRVTALANRMAHSRLASGLFPQLELACRDARRQTDDLKALTDSTANLRKSLLPMPTLGTVRPGP